MSWGVFFIDFASGRASFVSSAPVGLAPLFSAGFQPVTVNLCDIVDQPVLEPVCLFGIEGENGLATGFLCLSQWRIVLTGQGSFRWPRFGLGFRQFGKKFRNLFLLWQSCN